MTKLRTESIVEAYDALIDRAIQIANGAPYNMFCSEEDYARLQFEGVNAVLTWPEAQSGYYNSVSIEKQRVKFPAALLALSPEDFAKWKAAEQAKAQASAMERRAAEHRLNEMRERAALVKLKAKYPNG